LFLDIGFFIGIDGCHLEGPYKDVLLSAMSLDENNRLFYVAYVVVKCENNEICHIFFLYSLYGFIIIFIIVICYSLIIF